MYTLTYLLLLGTVSMGLNDITTIYRLNPTGIDDIDTMQNTMKWTATIEAHAKNVSDEFVFLDSDGSAMGPNVMVLFEECLATENGCKFWNMSADWEVIRNPKFAERANLPLGTFIYEDVLNNSLSHRRHFFKNLLISINFDKTSHVKKTSFSIVMECSKEEIFYVLQIVIEKNQKQGLLLQHTCTKEELNKDIDDCTIVHETHPSFSTKHEPKLNLTVIESELFIDVEDMSLVWDIGEDEVTHYIMNLTGASAIIKTQGEGQKLLSLQNTEGSINSTQEIEVINTRKICVAIECNLVHGTTLDVFAKSSNNKMYTFDKEKNFTHGWETIKYRLLTNDMDKEERLRIVVKAEKLYNDLYIQRIYNCSDHVNDDKILVIDEKEYEIPLTKIGFTNAQEYEQSTFSWSTVRNPTTPKMECRNGGSWELGAKKCTCPVGFNGTWCEEGCGPNRFGENCGSFCSHHTDGCKGLYLCRALQPCECGPGYHGPVCNRPCDFGYYGAGCKQHCGHCAVGTCNPYTGTCHHGCLPGYTLPLCKYTYNYLNSKPEFKKEGENTVIVYGNFQSITGDKFYEPKYYQLQYRVQNSSWRMQSRKEIEDIYPNNNMKHEVGQLSSLEPGTKYDVHIILTNKDSGSYDGEKVPITTFTTDCNEPDFIEYNLRVKQMIEEDGLRVTWDYSPQPMGSEFCVVTYFEVQVLMGWQWSVLKASREASLLNVTSLLPGQRYNVRMRAVTLNHPLYFSPTLEATVRDTAPPGYVQNLSATVESKNTVQVHWEPPRQKADDLSSYQILYECIRMLACPVDYKCNDSRLLQETVTSTQVTNLRSYTMYNISVWTIDKMGNVGPAQSIIITSEPSEATVDLTISKPEVTDDTSVTVYWNTPTDEQCELVNGKIVEYECSIKEADRFSRRTLETKTTLVPQITFTQLQPNTMYEVLVRLVTNVGKGRKNLQINGTTKLPAPGPVSNLMVYKSNSKFLWLRWEDPVIHGNNIWTYHIRYGLSGTLSSLMETKTSIQPPSSLRCRAWADKYCYNIPLLLNKAYDIEVFAKNKDIQKDGQISSLKSVELTEESPGQPRNIRIPSKSKSKVEVCWDYPDPPMSDITHFAVYLSTRPMPKMVDASEEKPHYCAIIENLRPDTEYSVSVVAHKISTTGKDVQIVFRTQQADN